MPCANVFRSFRDVLYTILFRFAVDARTTPAAAGHMAISATWPSCGASAEHPARKNPTIREKTVCPFILIPLCQVVFAVVSRSFRLAQQLSPRHVGRGSLVGTSRTMRDFRLLRIVLTAARHRDLLVTRWLTQSWNDAALGAHLRSLGKWGSRANVRRD